VDAAIAIRWCWGWSNRRVPVSAAALLLYWDGKQVVALDGRETAPMAAMNACS
jgi:gamma-glutamyltranspeptidase